MFDVLATNYCRDADLSNGGSNQSTRESHGPLLEDFRCCFGGASFNRGLYRVVGGDVDSWARRYATVVFPKHADGLTPFAYDWLGRIFVLNSAHLKDGHPEVVMLEPGTGSALKVEENLLSFHTGIMASDPEAVLAVHFHGQWLASGGRAPRYDECVGYKKPLFLGGADEVHNLELCGLEVYWHIDAQLISKTRGLPPGTRIGRIQ